LDADASLEGQTPTISAWTGDEESGYEAAEGFVFDNVQPNSDALEVPDPNGNVLENIQAYRGVVFRCTAPMTRGQYLIRSESDADDGTHVVRGGIPFDYLIVSGPGEPD